MRRITQESNPPLLPSFKRGNSKPLTKNLCFGHSARCFCHSWCTLEQPPSCFGAADTQQIKDGGGGNGCCHPRALHWLIHSSSAGVRSRSVTEVGCDPSLRRLRPYSSGASRDRSSSAIRPSAAACFRTILTSCALANPRARVVRSLNSRKRGSCESESGSPNCTHR